MSNGGRTGVLVVLAAGAGRRFGGCKQLAPVGPNGEALMDYTIDRARGVGFERIVVVTRPGLDGAMREHFDRGPSIELVHQPAGVAGTVPAVLAARGVVGGDEPFAVVNADDLYPIEALRALRAFGAWRQPGSGPQHAVLGFRLADTLLWDSDSDSDSDWDSDSDSDSDWDSGSDSDSGAGAVNRALCRHDTDGRVHGLAEATITTPAAAGGFVAGGFVAGGFVARGFVARARGTTADEAVAADQLVSMNAWAFHPSICTDFEAAVAAGAGAPAGEVLLPIVVDQLIARGAATVTVVPVPGRCIGITWPSELAIVRHLVLEMVAAGELPAGIAFGGAKP